MTRHMALPHTMTVTRLSTSGTNKELYTSRPDVACFLQPAVDTFVEGQPSTITKGRRCFVDFASNVKLKDKVTIDGDVYTVAGSMDRSYGSWPHRVLRLEELSK